LKKERKIRSIKISKSCLFLLFLLIISLFYFIKPSEAAKIKLRVIVQTANDRLDLDVNGPVVEKAPMGTILESEGKEEEWFKFHLPPDDSNFIIAGVIVPISF